jgi:hypothetical protein
VPDHARRTHSPGLQLRGRIWHHLVFAWFYYKRAGDELRAEAQALHTATGAILYYLEHPDAKIQVQRDDKGRVSGLIVSASGQATVTFSARGTLSDASGS